MTASGPDLIALEVAEVIVNTVEKGRWDHGQIDYERPEEEDHGRGVDMPSGLEVIDPIFAEPDFDDVDDPNRNAKDLLMIPDDVRPRRPATLRFWRGQILVKAPDYIHRASAGYPTNK